MAKPRYTGEQVKQIQNLLASQGGTVGAGSSKLTGLFSKMKGLKGAGAALLGYMILQRLMNIPAEAVERNVQREAIQAQGVAVTPENLYYQAALPQAQEEEAEARQALFARLGGGILGPSLPRGYRIIGRQ